MEPDQNTRNLIVRERVERGARRPGVPRDRRNRRSRFDHASCWATERAARARTQPAVDENAGAGPHRDEQPGVPALRPPLRSELDCSSPLLQYRLQTLRPTS
jgi:hypothetical protein